MAELGACGSMRSAWTKHDSSLKRGQGQLRRAQPTWRWARHGLHYRVLPARPASPASSGRWKLSTLSGRGRANCCSTPALLRTGGTVEQIMALRSGSDRLACQLSDGRMARPTSYMRDPTPARDRAGRGRAALGELIAALPKDLTISLEVPRLDALRGGMSPRDHAALRCGSARHGSLDFNPLIQAQAA